MIAPIKHRLFSNFGRQDAALLLRLASIYLGALGFRWLIISQTISPLFGRSSFIVKKEEYFPIILPGLLLAVLFFVLRTRLHKKPLQRPDLVQTTAALVATVVSAAALSVVMHPTPTQLQALNSFILTNPAIYNAAAIATLYLGFFAITLPLFFVVMPRGVLFDHKKTLVFGYVLYALYLYGDSMNTAYYRLTGPVMTDVIQKVLAYLPGGAATQISRWDITYQNFSVTFGSGCTELTALILLLGLLGYVCWQRFPHTLQGAMRFASIAVLSSIGLLVLNILRVVLIMIVGSWWPELGIGLFHGGIGAALLFGYIIAVIKLTLRFAPKK